MLLLLFDMATLMFVHAKSEPVVNKGSEVLPVEIIA